jgi:hypothetical protein
MFGQPSVLIFALDNWISIARLPKALKDAGFRVNIVAPRNSFLSKTKFVDQKLEMDLPLPGHEVIATFAKMVQAELPEVIVFGDDLAANVMWHVCQGDQSWLHKSGLSPEAQAVLNEALGGGKYRDIFRSKIAVNELAGQIKLRVPEYARISTIEDAHSFATSVGFPIILKPEAGSSSLGIAVVKDKAELDAIMPKILHYISINRNVPYVAQKFVEGTVVSYCFVSYQGKVLSGFGLQKEAGEPATFGPSTVLRAIANADAQKATEKLIAQSRFSGFGSCDFIVDHNGGAHFIELNARPVPASHLGSTFNADLAKALFNKLTGSRKRGSKSKDMHEIVALYPMEVLRDRNSSYIASGLHDLPSDDPELLASYEQLISDLAVA